MKVAIIGYGFVGKALHNGIKDDIEVFLVDPKLGTSVNDIKDFQPNIIFICVPTPMNDDGSQDIEILINTANKISKLKIASLIVLKSTVLPNFIEDLEKIIPSVLYNPEFLKESSANEDFISAELILIGGNKEKALLLSEFYKNSTKCIAQDHQFTDLISASLIKYSINNFLAAKVIFFNQLNDVFKNSGTFEEWENFTKILSVDSRIGKSHMEVPGPDGKRGFGGSCFPKDSNAFLFYSKDIKKPFTILERIISINNTLRSKYKSLNQREIEQNINFDEIKNK